MRAIRLAAGLAFAAAVAAEPAGAAVLPVAAGSAADLQARLDQAAASPEADVIDVPAGLYWSPDGFSYAAPASPVTVRGAGAGQTVLSSSAAPALAFDAGPSGEIQGLAVSSSSASAQPALQLDSGRGLALRVSRSGSEPGGSAALVRGGSELSGSTVTSSARGIEIGPGGGTVSAGTVTAAVGVHQDAAGPGKVVRTMLIPSRAGAAGVLLQSGTLSVQNTSVALNALPDAVGFSAAPAGGEPVRLELSHVTTFGMMTGNGQAGVLADPGQDGAALAVTITDSILWSTNPSPAPVLCRAPAAGGPAAQLEMRGVLRAPGAETGACAASDQAPLAQDPRFLGPASRDFRLTFRSPAIDRGLLPAPEGPDESGRPRTRDGDGDGRAFPDLGAYEYQRDPPAFTLAPVSASAAPGQPAWFSAQASDADFDPVDLTWTVGGQAAGSGPVMEWTPDGPGSWPVRAVAEDASGESVAAEATLTAAGPGPGGSAAPVRVLSAAADRRIRIGRARPAVSARGPIRWVQSSAGRVTVSFQRRLKGRWVPAGRLPASGKAGRNALRFAGRLAAGRALPAGPCQVTVASGASRASARFTLAAL